MAEGGEDNPNKNRYSGAKRSFLSLQDGRGLAVALRRCNIRFPRLRFYLVTRPIN
jgi:hypothetical protein